MSVFDDETVVFDVVVNHEEQYSIWPSYRDPPNGWRCVGVRGTREACLTHIEAVWTDMRPLSVRRHDAAARGASSPSRVAETPPGNVPPPEERRRPDESACRPHPARSPTSSE